MCDGAPPKDSVGTLKDEDRPRVVAGMEKGEARTSPLTGSAV